MLFRFCGKLKCKKLEEFGDDNYVKYVDDMNIEVCVTCVVYIMNCVVIVSKAKRRVECSIKYVAFAVWCAACSV